MKAMFKYGNLKSAEGYHPRKCPWTWSLASVRLYPHNQSLTSYSKMFLFTFFLLGGGFPKLIRLFPLNGLVIDIGITAVQISLGICHSVTTSLEFYHWFSSLEYFLLSPAYLRRRVGGPDALMPRIFYSIAI